MPLVFQVIGAIFIYFNNTLGISDKFTRGSFERLDGNGKNPFYRPRYLLHKTYNELSHSKIIKRKAQYSAKYVICPKLPSCGGGGECGQKDCISPQKNNVLYHYEKAVMMYGKPQRSEKVVVHPENSSGNAGKQKKPKLLLHGKKCLGNVHRKSLPRADTGAFLSRSPYTADHISPVITMSPVSTLMESMCSSLPLIVSSPS